MSQFGHYRPYEVVPDPFVVDLTIWDEPVQPDPFDEPLPEAWDDEEVL